MEEENIYASKFLNILRSYTFQRKASTLWSSKEKQGKFLDIVFGKDREEDPFLPIDPPESHDVTKRGMNLLKSVIDKVNPLYLLNKRQKDILFSRVKFTQIEGKKLIFGQDKTEDSFAAYILLEGNLAFFGLDAGLIDMLDPISLFGYDGPIFGHRLTTVVGKNSLLAIIPKETFLEMIIPFSNFAIYLERTIKLKDKILEPLDKYKQYILSCVNGKCIDFEMAMDLYKKTDPCIHPKVNSKEIDFMAWTYALNRLPSNIWETYYYSLQNKPPFLLRLKTDNPPKDILSIENKARPRTIFWKNGKGIVLLRDMESDTLDFVSNMVIFLIESGKMRKELLNPTIIRTLFAEINEGKNTFESTIECLKKNAKLEITDEEKDALKSYFKDDFGKRLVDCIWNHQTISVSIQKKVTGNKLPIEQWSEKLVADIQKCLGNTRPFGDIYDLVVDICQGSTTTLLRAISPHLYKHQKEILDWAKKNNIQLITKKFLNETDKLIAYSTYYYKMNPDKEKEQQEELKKHGILVDRESLGTGVAIILVNVNKLDPNYIDPNLEYKPASKNHIILQLGYTFGNQSREIINPVLMMLGRKARSLNIIGKAGGLVGNRTDILAASRVFCDKGGEMVNLNMGRFNIEDFKKKVNTGVHVGPLLCVAGTILQNYDLLNYYTKVNGCIGLEMEGFYFAQEVNEGISHGMLRSDFISRFFYYVSDLPLVVGETLSAEAGNVCWDEGVSSMNAIERHILNCIFH